MSTTAYSLNEVLRTLRSIMDNIHAGGSIFYDPARLQAYAIVARTASNIRAKGEL